MWTIYLIQRHYSVGVDLANMQLKNRFNKGSRFWLCVINIYSKYAWFVPLKDKNDITITKAFQKMLDESGLKPNKMWVDKVIEFYNRSMKSWLQDTKSTNIWLKYKKMCIWTN